SSLRLGLHVFRSPPLAHRRRALRLPPRHRTHLARRRASPRRAALRRGRMGDEPRALVSRLVVAAVGPPRARDGGFRISRASARGLRRRRVGPRGTRLGGRRGRGAGRAPRSDARRFLFLVARDVGLVFVLVGELLAAYLTRRSGLPV